MLLNFPPITDEKPLTLAEKPGFLKTLSKGSTLHSVWESKIDTREEGKAEPYELAPLSAGVQPPIPTSPITPDPSPSLPHEGSKG